MISIIVSSYQKHYFGSFTKNVSETIGVPYEIIDIWNPGKMGISKAYNLGASKSQFPYLVFCHEDILLHTQHWGEKLLENLQSKEVGVIGVAGSNYVPHLPIGWFINAPKYQFTHVIQNNKEGNNPEFLNHLLAQKTPVFGVDGLFMAMRKNVYNEHKYNESLEDFHGYDLEISLRKSRKFKNYIVKNILIEHFSLGNASKTHFDANIKIRKELGCRF